eukprot:TRINITY_DN6700_c0_g1_i1.p1 TRINITY_DN6700_c0_g1~~TRINITY_DN6700_c0_g1_i1.p1  ORF type:complete len:209 (-),score=31.56 TRINITY_DN6700_c0_g1_i1:127-753(-)
MDQPVASGNLPRVSPDRSASRLASPMANCCQLRRVLIIACMLHVTCNQLGFTMLGKSHRRPVQLNTVSTSIARRSCASQAEIVESGTGQRLPSLVAAVCGALLLVAGSQASWAAPSAKDMLLEEAVARKAAAKGCYMKIEGKTYDTTNMFANHRGGPVVLAEACCTDATAKFKASHEGWFREPKARQALEKLPVISEEQYASRCVQSQ